MSDKELKPPHRHECVRPYIDDCYKMGLCSCECGAQRLTHKGATWTDRTSPTFCPTCEHDGTERSPFDANCPAAWAHACLVRWAAPTPPPPSETPEGIAKRFHDAYERLAPNFGYTTRKASAVPWEQVPENNRNLMIAVCSELFPISPPPSETRMTKQGTWPIDCVQRAFVDGAAWWEFQSADATMWQSDRDRAEAEAVRRFGEPDSESPISPPPSETRDLALLRIYGTFRRNVLKAYHKGDWEAVSIALGAFNTSCDTLPPLDEPKVIQSSAPPSETKLSDAIDAFDMAIRNDWIDSDVSRSDVRAARSSLESLYRETLDDLRLSEKAAETWRIACDQNAEALSALRSLQLTEDERQFITDGLLLHAPGWRIPDALSEKLRISSKATSEEL